MADLKTYILDPILNVFRFHKFKIFFVFLVTLVFYVLFFPYHQLSGLIESQINKNSRGQLQVSFNNLSLSVVPFGISAENISIFTPSMKSPLIIKKAYIRPSIADLLKFKKGGYLIAENIWGGQLNLKFSDLGQGTSNNKQSEMVKVFARFEKINLNKLANWYQTPFTTAGSISGQLDLTVDQKAFEQPLGTFSIKGGGIKLPSTVKVMQMDLQLPSGQWKSLDIKGKIAAGQFTLLESRLGAPSDGINGRIKGSMGLTLRSIGGRLSPRPSQYDFSLDLNLDKTSEQKIGTLLSTVLLNGKGGKSPTVDGGARYLIGLKGFPGSTPNIEPLSTF